jgi:GNAT superfamily N-acetyltransferase
MLKQSLRKIKNRIKDEPMILIKKPWLLFVIPVIIPIIIVNRLKRSESVVYLTETELAGLFRDDGITEVTDGNFKTIARYNEFTDYALKRISEDCDSGEFSLDNIRRRFDRGDYAIVYLNTEREPLSWVFISTKLAEFTPVGISLILPDRTFGMYDVYTFKKARGKGYYSQLFHYAASFMINQGFEYMWLWLMAHNTVSVKVHRKLGVTRINKILKERLSFGFIKRTINDAEMSIDELDPDD